MLQTLINIAAAEAVGVAVTVMSASTGCFDKVMQGTEKALGTS